MAAAESGRKVYAVVGVSIGLLFILQAVLNICLRLESSTSTTSNIETSSKNLCKESVMPKIKSIDCEDNKTLDIETRFKTLTEEMNELKRKMIVYANYFQQGWVYFNFSGSIYYISSEMKTWRQSRDACLRKGADLMIINSKEEQALTRHWKDDMWIGLTRSDTRSQWKWVDGTPLTTSYWIDGEPNNYELNNENCVEVRYHKWKNSWNDKPCNVKKFWICEKQVSV